MSQIAIDVAKSTARLRRLSLGLAMVALCVLPTLSLAAGTVPATRSLTFEQRVEAQHAIEQVYWNHRIWPKENPGKKPALSAVMPDSAIRAKVEESLRMSALLDSYWHQPLTAAQLQAEIDRMARQTKASTTLHDLFTALHDDPFLIAECLARPALARRRVASAFAADGRIHGPQRATLVSELAGVEDDAAFERLEGDHAAMTFLLDDKEDVKVAHSRPDDRAIHVTREEWNREISRLAASFDPPPEGTPFGSADGLSAVPVGTVSRLIEQEDRFIALTLRAKSATSVTIASVSWAKPSYDLWVREKAGSTKRDVTAIPPPVGGYTTSMVTVVGCVNDSWAAATGAPGRSRHTAIWTGSEMIVWGGDDGLSYLNTGGRYDPSTDTWAASSLVTGSGPNVPSGRDYHTAVWTGSEMIVWGGLNSQAILNTGGRYNPSTDSWAASSLVTGAGANAPTSRFFHTAVWTGSEMIVWGGYDAGVWNTGGRYNPSTDSWVASSLTSGAGANVPAARELHTAVWTGTEMIVWGGEDTASYLNTGGRYNPSTDSWATSSLTTGAGIDTPIARDFHTAVWTGSEMIVWGGEDGGLLNTGGRYNPATDAWVASSLTTGSGANVPSYRELHTAVWTGSEMIVWGGFSTDGPNNLAKTGGRYTPSTDSWAVSSLTAGSGANVPSGRESHTAVWTGVEMIVWGGDEGATFPNQGGGYCACVNGLLAYRDADGDGYGNPSAPNLICGGSIPPGYVADHADCDDGNAAIHPGTVETCNGVDDNCNGQIDDGVLTTFYRDADGDGFGDPATTSLACSVPSGYVAGNTDCNDASAAIHPGAVEVCNTVDDNCNGQIDEGVSVATGWGATAATAAPSARSGHVGVGTSSLAIVWGGADAGGLTNTGSRYDPTADVWTSTSTAGAPSARRDSTAVWTGTQMIVWGGQDSGGATRTGAVYQPSNDTWSNISTSGLNGSFFRSLHTAVWTGSKMIVWGGKGTGSDLSTGGQWEQSTNSWTANITGPLSPRFSHIAVWTGTKMIVWGGENSTGTVFGDGAVYDPGANTWTAMSSSGAPSARTKHAAVWTGSKMIVWGGWNNSGTFFADGAAYDPSSNTWSPVSSSGAPSARMKHAAVWDPTDGVMIVWGGRTSAGTVFNDGAAYSPSTNTWSPLSSTNAPIGRSGHVGVWVAGLPGMVVWGGDGTASAVNTGGRYVVTRPTCGLGPCARQGVYGCTAEPLTYTCTPGLSQPETCNGIDDDCNGTVDDGFASQPTSCGVGGCARTGATSCVGGVVHDSCVAGQPAAEVCNGIDDDCNGFVDDGGASALCNDANVCTDDFCNGGGGCAHANNSGPCNDGNACTQTDTCQAGGCVGSNAVVCTASDQCHLAGTCAPGTGMCSQPSVADGTSCNDGNACTLGEACSGGVCTNGSPITAPPETQNLVVAANKSTVSWSAAAFATQYDVVRGSTGALPVGPGGADEVCFNNLAGPSVVDAAIPAPGTGFWYVSRGEDSCGIGTYGTRSNGSPRVTTTCQCIDGAKDGDETDVDCGGAVCSACATGKLCNGGADCQSGVCASGHCAAPACTDGVKNGSETGVDCGWASCGPCPDTRGCLVNSDCRSGSCQGGICQPASCTSGLATGDDAKVPDAECGSSGNTYWTQTVAAPSVALTMDDTNSSIYLTSGTTVSRLDPVTGAVLKVRDFSTVTPTRPIVPRVKGGAANEVVIGGSDGYVYGLDPVTLTTTWSRSVKRSTCSTDSIEATPVVQRWDASDANFQAARTQDLMILGTSYGCSTTTANKVIAIDGSNGNIVWSHNSTGTYAIDKIGGLAVDYGRNLVYVTAYLTDPTRTQETVFALRTTDGGRVWYRTLGSMIAEPVLANGGLYVATVAGVLYKLDPSSGNTIWQSTITAGGAQIVRLAAEGSTGRVYVPDTAGGLHAVNDQCATSSLAWTTTLSGSLVSTTPAILGSVLYVGGKDGRVYQLGAADGASQSYATVSGGAATSFDPIIYLDGSSTRLLASAGGVIKKLCIPWAADHSDKALLMVPAAVDPDASAPDAAVASVERGRSDATKARADDDRRVGGE